MENEYNTAYIIAGETRNGQTVYYGYDFTTNRWDWFFSAVEQANLFRYESAKTFLDHIKDENDNGYIRSVWIEKLTTIPLLETKITF